MCFLRICKLRLLKTLREGCVGCGQLIPRRMLFVIAQAVMQARLWWAVYCFCFGTDQYISIALCLLCCMAGFVCFLVCLALVVVLAYAALLFVHFTWLYVKIFCSRSG